jgi:acyl-CoA thioesterase-1
MRSRPGQIAMVMLACFGLAAGLWLAACQPPPSEPGASSSGPSSLSTSSREGFAQQTGNGAVGASQSRDKPNTERPRIIALGDSLTAGLGVASTDSYPSQLQQRLDQAGYRYRVINAGVSGDTTAGALRRVDWVLKNRPRIVIVELGANDGLRGLDLKEMRANLARIIERLQAAGVTVVLAGMKLPPNYGADYSGRFAALYPDLARKYGVIFMSFFLEEVAAQATLNQADGIHPTEAGYRVIVDHLMPVLEPLLNKTPAGRS